MAGKGADVLRIGRKHVGERYVWGAIAPKNNSKWKGPWDCAEFTSWLAYQVAARLYGCYSNRGNPATADAYTGFWVRDANSVGKAISVAEAARTPGAAVLRHSAASGHIVISDGKGGTVEAKSTATGVVEDTLSARRWDIGVLVPGISYSTNGEVPVPDPGRVIYRLTKPPMTGEPVREIQRALKEAGMDPGPIDGVYGAMTAAAVTSYQAARRLVVDGEVGPQTARSLGIKLPQA